MQTAVAGRGDTGAALPSAVLLQCIELLFTEAVTGMEDTWRATVRETRQGWVKFEVIRDYLRDIAGLDCSSQSNEDLASLVQDSSELLVLNDDCSMVRRKNPMQRVDVPYCQSHSVVVEHLPADATAEAVKQRLILATATSEIKIQHIWLINGGSTRETDTMKAIAASVRQHTEEPAYAIVHFKTAAEAARVANAYKDAVAPSTSSDGGESSLAVSYVQPLGVTASSLGSSLRQTHRHSTKVTPGMAAGTVQQTGLSDTSSNTAFQRNLAGDTRVHVARPVGRDDRAWASASDSTGVSRSRFNQTTPARTAATWRAVGDESSLHRPFSTFINNSGSRTAGSTSGPNRSINANRTFSGGTGSFVPLSRGVVQKPATKDGDDYVWDKYYAETSSMSIEATLVAGDNSATTAKDTSCSSDAHAVLTSTKDPCAPIDFGVIERDIARMAVKNTKKTTKMTVPTNMHLSASAPCFVPTAGAADAAATHSTLPSSSPSSVAALKDGPIIIGDDREGNIESARSARRQFSSGRVALGPPVSGGYLF